MVLTRAHGAGREIPRHARHPGVLWLDGGGLWGKVEDIGG